MNSAALRAAALAAAIGVATTGAAGSKKTTKRKPLFNLDTNGDGIVRMNSKVRILPAESAEQLIPPGTKITKEALRKAAAQFSMQKVKKVKKGEVAGLNFRAKGTAT